MLAFIALFFPAAIMVVWKRRLFKEDYDWKAMLMEYIAGVMLINFLVIAIAYLFFGSKGSVVSNINTYNGFALKYMLLAFAIALLLPLLYVLAACRSHKEVKPAANERDSLIASEQLHMFKIITASIFSILCTALLSILLERNGIPRYSMLYIFICIIFFYSFLTKANSFKTEIFCYLFAFTYLVGLRLNAGYLLGISSLAALLIASVGAGRAISSVGGSLISCVRKHFIFCRNGRISKFKPIRWFLSLSNGRKFLILAILLILFWLPVFLAYYPGIFGYDVTSQITQMQSGYTTHHPLLHTLLLDGFYMLGELLGNINLGIAFYTIFQMMLFSMAISYMMIWLINQKASGKLIILVFLFMGFMPIISMLVISVTKDILFSAAFLITFVCLSDFQLNHENLRNKKKLLLFSVTSVCTCLLRNQGFLIIVGTFIIWTILFVGAEKKRVFSLCCLIIVASLVANHGLISITGANTGSSNEMLSVPYQQISRVYKYEYNELEPSDIEYIEYLIPNVDSYRADKADPVKSGARADEDYSAFINIYLKLAVKYPFRYVEAFLLNTMDYWYVNGTNSAEIYGSGLEGRQGYLLSDTKPDLGVEHVSFNKPLEWLYEKLFSENKYLEIPLLAVLFNLSIYVWMFIAAIFAYLRMRNLRLACPPMFMIFIFLVSIFLGPCTLPRYILPLILCLPVFLIFMYKQGTIAFTKEGMSE